MTPPTGSATLAKVHITMLLVRHPATRTSPILPEVVRRLREAGAEVAVVHPDEIDPDGAALEATDLCVLKAKTPAALRLAGRYHAAGVRTLNPYPVTELCRDKIATNRALEAAGVPVPPTYVEQDARALAPLLVDGPLIVKPFRGSQGRGIEVVEDAEQLARIDHGPDPVMAQRYFAPDGKDRKIYRIGAEVFCVERIWPPVTFADKLGRLVGLDAETEDVARRCGDALGIALYGVDIIHHRGRPWVVDLSSFPGFKGVPEAAARLTALILRTASAEAAG